MNSNIDMPAVAPVAPAPAPAPAPVEAQPEISSAGAAPSKKTTQRDPEHLEKWLKDANLAKFVGMKEQEREALLSEITKKITEQGNEVKKLSQNLINIINELNDNLRNHTELHRFVQKVVTPTDTLRLENGPANPIPPLQSIAVKIAHNRHSNFLVPPPYSKKPLKYEGKQAEFMKAVAMFKLFENEEKVVVEYRSKQSQSTEVELAKKQFERGKYRDKFIQLQVQYLAKFNNLLRKYLPSHVPVVREDFDVLKNNLIFENDTSLDNYTGNSINIADRRLQVRELVDNPGRLSRELDAAWLLADPPRETYARVLRNKKPEQRRDEIDGLFAGVMNFSEEVHSRNTDGEIQTLGSIVEDYRPGMAPRYYWKGDPQLIKQYIRRGPGGVVGPNFAGAHAGAKQLIYGRLNALVQEHGNIFEIEKAVAEWQEELAKLNKGFEVKQAAAFNDKIKQAAKKSAVGGQNLDDTSKEYASIVEKLCGTRAKLFWYAQRINLGGDSAGFIKCLRKQAHFYGLPYYPWMDTRIIGRLKSSEFCKVLEFNERKEEHTLSGAVGNMDDVYARRADLYDSKALLDVYDVPIGGRRKGYLSRSEYKLMVCRLGLVETEEGQIARHPLNPTDSDDAITAAAAEGSLEAKIRPWYQHYERGRFVAPGWEFTYEKDGGAAPPAPGPGWTSPPMHSRVYYQLGPNPGDRINITPIPKAGDACPANTTGHPPEVEALPTGWEVRLDAGTGRPFYTDHNTQTVQWPAPPPLQNQPTVALASSGLSLHSRTLGWPVLYGPHDLSAHLWVLMSEQDGWSIIREKGFRGALTDWVGGDKAREKGGTPIHWSSYLDYENVPPPELPKLPLELETYRTEVLPIFPLVKPGEPAQQSILNMRKVNAEINASIMTLFSPSARGDGDNDWAGDRFSIILGLQHKPLREVLLGLFYELDGFDPQEGDDAAVPHIEDKYLLPFCYGGGDGAPEVRLHIANNLDSIQGKFNIYDSRERNQQVFNQFWDTIDPEDHAFAMALLERFRVTTKELLDLIYKMAGPIQEHFQKIIIESSTRGTSAKLESMAHKYGLHSLNTRNANETLFMDNSFPVTPIVHLRLKEKLRTDIPKHFDHLRVYKANFAAFKKLVDVLEKNKVNVRKWSEWWSKNPFTPSAISKLMEVGVKGVVPMTLRRALSDIFNSIEQRPISSEQAAFRKFKIAWLINPLKEVGVNKIDELLKMLKKYEGGVSGLLGNVGSQTVKSQAGGASSTSADDKFTLFGRNIVNRLSLNEDDKYRLTMIIDIIAGKIKKEYNDKLASQKQAAQKQDAQKQDAQKQDAQKQASQRQASQKQDAQKQDAQKQDAQKQDAQRQTPDEQSKALMARDEKKDIGGMKDQDVYQRQADSEATSTQKEDVKKEAGSTADEKELQEKSVQEKLMSLLSTEDKSEIRDSTISISGDNPKISRIYEELERLRKENLALKNEREDFERSSIYNTQLLESSNERSVAQGHTSDIAFDKYQRALQRVSQLKEEQDLVSEKHAQNIIQDKLLSEKREKLNEDAKALLGQLNTLQESELREKVNSRRALLQNEETPVIMAYPVKKSEGMDKTTVRTPRKRKHRRRRRKSVNKKAGV